MARLPELTAEELDELHDAIKERMNVLAGVRAKASAPELLATIDHKGLVLQSLSTAVAEARLSLRR